MQRKQQQSISQKLGLQQRRGMQYQGQQNIQGQFARFSEIMAVTKFCLDVLHVLSLMIKAGY